jgi:hypothetical protein
MKKFRLIIVALFVMAVGAGIFWACQKEDPTTNTSVTTKSKKIIHKNADNAYFFYETNPNVLYRLIDSVAVTLDGGLFIGDAYMKGGREYDDKGNYIGICCDYPGSNCGDVEIRDDDDNILCTGLYVIEADVIYIDLDCDVA